MAGLRPARPVFPRHRPRPVPLLAPDSEAALSAPELARARARLAPGWRLGPASAACARPGVLLLVSSAGAWVELEDAQAADPHRLLYAIEKLRRQPQLEVFWRGIQTACTADQRAHNRVTWG